MRLGGVNVFLFFFPWLSFRRTSAPTHGRDSDKSFEVCVLPGFGVSDDRPKQAAIKATMRREGGGHGARGEARSTLYGTGGSSKQSAVRSVPDVICAYSYSSNS